MAVDFMANNYICTSLGNYYIPVFYYDGDLISEPYMDYRKTYYKGTNLTDVTAVTFAFSTIMDSPGRYQWSPLLNSGAEIEIFNKRNEQYPGEKRVRFTASGTGNNRVFTGTIANANTFAVSFDFESASAAVKVVGLGIIVDANGKGAFFWFQVRALTASSALFPNTLIDYGYFEGKENWNFTIPGPGPMMSPIMPFEETYPDLLSNVIPDPYSPGGTSEPGGGDGDFDFTSTDIPIPGLPAIGAHDAGFLSLFAPSATELRAMASYMWAGAFDPANFKKLFANPMDAILGLHIVPRTATAPATTPSSLVIGNISTGLSMPKCTEQYYELDCGTIQIPAKWGAYLDYAPYSKLSLYLPYVGFVEISPDDCMRGDIRVVYHVDILSGSCAVFVYCTSNRGADGHILYTYTGACACDCPVTEGQYTNAVMGILSIAASAASGIMAGATGNAAGAVASVGSVADAAISMAKPQISRSGSFGGSAGLMGIQYPFLVLTVPRMCTPEDQHIYLGYPSLITSELGDISGYAEVEVTHLAGMPCTEAEALEILDLLRKGVIF